MAYFCVKIKTQYQEIKTKQANFHALALDLRTNRAPLVVIKKEIQALLVWFENNIGLKIRVENMPTPFVEVYAENRLAIPEKETQIIDLETQMEEDCATYRECGLESWAEDIEKWKLRLKKLIRKNKGQIVKEIKNRAIVIFMPGRAVQYADAVETLTKKLKPVCVENGNNKSINDGVILWERLIRVLEQIAKEKTVNVPEEPYLMLVNPWRRSRLVNMTVYEQEKKLIEMNIEREKEDKSAEYAIMPIEYATMQMFFTRRATKNNTFKNVFPLDQVTFTRFLKIITTNEEFLARAHCSLNGLRLSFGLDSVIENMDGGVRFVVRLS